MMSRKRHLLAAMSVLVLVIPASQRPEPVLATRASEWHTFKLEDGTSATFGPRTTATLAFENNRRVVRLLSGEAYFKVAKDPARPFIVQTPVGCAKALGTIYAVTHHLRSTSVTTQEGIVATARLDQTDETCTRDSIRLFANQKAVIESWTPLVAREVDTTVELAWTHRQIIFTGQTVEQALGEFNRRNWVQLDLPESPEVLKIRIMGPFPLDDPERFANYLEKEPRWRSQKQ